MMTLCVASLASRRRITHSLSLVCMAVLAWTSFCLAFSSEKPMVSLEVHYEIPAAGAVELIWGVNGWQPVQEEIRPLGTKLRTVMSSLVMSTPMVRSNDVFIATIQAEAGTEVNYQFLITKTAGAAPIETWDRDESYRHTIKSSQ